MSPKLSHQPHHTQYRIKPTDESQMDFVWIAHTHEPNIHPYIHIAHHSNYSLHHSPTLVAHVSIKLKRGKICFFFHHAVLLPRRMCANDMRSRSDGRDAAEKPNVFQLCGKNGAAISMRATSTDGAETKD